MVTLEYLERFLADFAYPDDARVQLTEVYARILQSEALCRRMDAAEEKLFEPDLDRMDYAIPLEGMAMQIGAAPQSILLLCMLQASDKLLAMYEEHGVSKVIWRDTMLDFHTKAIECRKLDGVYGLYGTGTPAWMVNYFRMQRFALGRLQYEIGQLKAEECVVGGLTLKKGDPVLCCHIPSNGQPFDEKTRLASYKAAYAFYRAALPTAYGGMVPITCDSWLLFPDHADMLGEKSNITGFMKEFMPLRVDRMKTHTNLWRIFWKADTEHPETLPENTGLERAYKKRLMQGGDVGFGYGIFLFDGEKIINQ